MLWERPNRDSRFGAQTIGESTQPLRVADAVLFKMASPPSV